MELKKTFQEAKNSCRTLINLSEQQINNVLVDLSNELVSQAENILAANQKDLDRMEIENPKYDRLKLTVESINSIASDLKNVASLPTPIGEVLMEKKMPNGLAIKKVRVPLGVIGVIYEARPNVTVDVFSLCFKTSNVAILKGGSDAEFSNLKLAEVIHQILINHDIPTPVLTLLPADRSATEALLNATGFVDVLIPRGSQSLINYVRDNSRIPVIETGAGIVHVYFDESGDLEKGKNIILNAKTRRVSVCNALDCLLVNRKRLNDLTEMLAPLASEEVIIYADPDSYKVLEKSYPLALLEKANFDDFGTEFLSLKMAVKTVSDLESALAHISQFSSKHSEAIISEDAKITELFLNQVDAAAVYVNASTAFTDGAQFGLGAEIGISTQKLHARGPMGLEELTSYKWIVRGDGQVRG